MNDVIKAAELALDYLVAKHGTPKQRDCFVAKHGTGTEFFLHNFVVERLRTALAASQEKPTVSPDAKAEAKKLATTIASDLILNEQSPPPLNPSVVIASGILPLISARDTANAIITKLCEVFDCSPDKLPLEAQGVKDALAEVLCERDELRERLGKVEGEVEAYAQTISHANHHLTLSDLDEYGNLAHNEVKQAMALSASGKSAALASLTPKGDANENE